MLLAGQHFDAKAEPQVCDKIAVIVVAGASRFMRGIADLRAFLVAVERLHGVINIKDPREEHSPNR